MVLSKAFFAPFRLCEKRFIKAVLELVEVSIKNHTDYKSARAT